MMLKGGLIQYAIAYISVSIALLSWSIYDSLEISPNLFTFLIELTVGFKLAILINSLLLSFGLISKTIQVIVFGELRVIETEHLAERIPFFFLNLLFNLIDRRNDTVLNCLLLGIAVTDKMFQSLLMDRFDFINMKIFNASSNASLTKLQVLAKFVMSLHFWLLFILFAYEAIAARLLIYDVFGGVNSITSLLFGFQLAAQAGETLSYVFKVMLNIYELVFYRTSEELPDEMNEVLDDEEEEGVWENKSLYVKGIDIGCALLRAISFLGFIYLLAVHSGIGLPLSMIQGTYLSIKQAYDEIGQLIVFVRAARRLDSMLPNATAEDLNSSDRLCIVCRADMKTIEEYETQFHRKPSERRCPKKLRCGHILHMGCLKDWLERSDACPLCRKKVLASENTATHTERDNHGTAAAPQEPPTARSASENTNLAESNSNVTSPPNASDATISNTPGNTQPLYSAANASNVVALNEAPGNYQDFVTNAHVPPDWMILPLRKQDDDTFKVRFSNHLEGDLKVERNERGSEVRLMRLDSFSGENSYP